MRMFYRKDNAIVEVYKFFENKTALIFSPSIAGNQNGNGWQQVKVSQLIPIEYYDENKNGFMSNTERTKIKKRLTLTEAKWACTDGVIFNDCDKAIAHERELIDKVDEDQTPTTTE